MPPHTLKLEFPRPNEITRVLLDQRQDRKLTGQVKDVELFDQSGRSLARVQVPKNVKGFAIPLPAGTGLKTLSIKVHSSHAGPYACLADVDLVSDSKN